MLLLAPAVGAVEVIVTPYTNGGPPNRHGEPGPHVAWEVRLLRETGEGAVGEGLPVDRVVGAG
jgi:hypothetical protein